MMFPHPTAPSRQDPLPETSIQFYSSFCFVKTRTPWMMKLSTDLLQNVEHVANIGNFRSATEIYYLNLQLHSPLHLSSSRQRIRKQIQMDLSLHLGNPRRLLHSQTEKSSNWATMGLGFSDNTSRLASLTIIQANISHVTT